MKWNSFFIVLILNILSGYVADAVRFRSNKIKKLVKPKSTTNGSSGTAELKIMMQVLDDNYQFAHKGVQEYLGIKVLTVENTAKRLQQACFVGNTEAIKKMIKEGVDIRMHSDIAIKTAADMNHNHIVKGLYKYGYRSENVNKYIVRSAVRNNIVDLIQFIRGENELIFPELFEMKIIAMGEAVRFGKLNIIESIFSSGFNCDVIRGYLVKLARMKGFADMIKCLNDNGMNFECDKNRALIWASKLGHIEIAVHLISVEANIHSENGKALRLACKNGHADLVELLLKNGANVNVNDDLALLDASWNGHTDVVEILLRNGANSKNRNNLAVRTASWNGHADVVKLLFEYGADIHADNDDALKLACGSGHTAVVKVLLDTGEDFNASYRALLLAIEHGHYDVVKVLLEKIKVNIHAEDDYALRLAYKRGHANIINLLLQNGANGNVIDDEALRLANSREKTKISKIIEDYRDIMNESSDFCTVS